MKTLTKNVKGSIGIGIISLIYLYQAFEYPLGSLREPGPGLIPVVFAFALIGFCVLQIIMEFLVTQPGNEKNTDGNTTYPARPIILIVSLFVFCIVFSKLGFILSSIPLIFVILRVMQYKSKLMSLVVSVIVTLIAYYIFSELLGVSFPPGILG